MARYLVVALALAAAIAFPLATKPRPIAAVVAAAGVTAGVTAGAVVKATAATEPSLAGASRPQKRPARRSATASTSSGHLATPADVTDTPAYRYARLSQTECEAELAARHIDYTQATAIAVAEPVRLSGPLHGVLFRTDQTARTRPTSPYEIADCRLVLALDDFAEILSRHDIVEVRHYSMYRPPKTWSDDKPATRHPGALAIDAGRFIDRAGAVLDVDRDFHGAIDATTCGDGAAPRPATASALVLRAILCETVDRRLFNVVLTPNYNRAHHNHFHLEITAGVSWFLVH